MITTLIVLAVVALVMTFVFAVIEEALTRLSRVRAAELIAEGRPGTVSLQRIVEDTPGYLSVVSFVRICFEAAATVFVTMAVVNLGGEGWRTLLVAIGIMILVSFALVGVSPRTLGRQHADTAARLGAPIAVGLRRTLGPIARLLVLFANAVTPGRGYKDGPFTSESELRGLLDLAGERDLIEDDEREMIHSVFELGDTLAREVMVPRPDMVTIDADRTCRNGMSLFLRSGFSRIPVAGEGSDDILGILYFKDIVRRVNADPEAGAQLVTSVMRPAHFVPESKPVDDLLREMQVDQTHLAVVVDEYGGTAGIITIEDILEEIVGEIADEFDREGPEVEDLGDGTYRVEASMAIEDLGELFDLELEDDEVSTVGGLIGKTLGRVPIVGSTCEVSGLVLTAERMAGRRHRIATVIVEPTAALLESRESAPDDAARLDREVST